MPDFDKLAFPGSGCVQVVETAVRDCAIESVVVYADRAEVKRRVPVNLAAGKNEVVVHGLSTCINKNSIRLVGVYTIHNEGKTGVVDRSDHWDKFQAKISCVPQSQRVEFIPVAYFVKVSDCQIHFHAEKRLPAALLTSVRHAVKVEGTSWPTCFFCRVMTGLLSR